MLRVERGRESEANLAALERKISQQAIEIDFLTQALQRVEDLRRPSIVSGGTGHIGAAFTQQFMDSPDRVARAPSWPLEQIQSSHSP